LACLLSLQIVIIWLMKKHLSFRLWVTAVIFRSAHRRPLVQTYT
jgi:hypothetical protein